MNYTFTFKVYTFSASKSILLKTITTTLTTTTTTTATTSMGWFLAFMVKDADSSYSPLNGALLGDNNRKGAVKRKCTWAVFTVY